MIGSLHVQKKSYLGIIFYFSMSMKQISSIWTSYRHD